MEQTMHQSELKLFDDDDDGNHPVGLKSTMYT